MKMAGLQQSARPKRGLKRPSLFPRASREVGRAGVSGEQPIIGSTSPPRCRKIAGSRASLENGLLHVDLVREIPEAMKPRSIPIASSSKLLEVKPTKVAA